MRNASDRKSIRAAEKFAGETERARIEFIKAAMSTIQGRAYFHGLLSFCNIFDGSFSGDALLEAFTKGQRNIGLLIYSDIVRECPNEFVLMMNEATIQEIVNDRRTSPNSSPDAEFNRSSDGGWDPNRSGGDDPDDLDYND